VAKAWDLTVTGATVEVRSECDRVGPPREVVIESSSGHGSSLGLFRVVAADDSNVRITALELEPENRAERPDAEPWDRSFEGAGRVRSVVVPRDVWLHTWGAMRASMQVSARQQDPPMVEGRMFGMSMSMSSNDFFVGIEVRDAEGFGEYRRFAGYAGSLHQSERLPLELARKHWAEFWYDEAIQDALVPRVPTAEDRDFFAQRFVAGIHRHADFEWYVRERLVAMAGSLGDPRIVPLLLDLAAPSPGQGAASDDRIRFGALEALVLLTGLDPRFDADGAPRAVEDVRRDFVDACG